MTGQPSADPAALGRIRREVSAALAAFLGQQRQVLAEIGPDMLPCLDAMEGLLAGGKRLRPAFCYWGWRAAGGPDRPEIYPVLAALELLHASALVHDDVMDASDTRRGRPAVHRQFARRLGAAAAPAGPEGRPTAGQATAGPGGRPAAGDMTAKREGRLAAGEVTAGPGGRAAAARVGAESEGQPRLPAGLSAEQASRQTPVPAGVSSASRPGPEYSESAERFGLGAAILIGDMLLTWTDELYHGSGLPAEVLGYGQPALNAMRTEVVAGQYLDLLSQVTHSSSVTAALRVVTYKTAKYTIERPLQLGAALAVGAQARPGARMARPGGGWADADARTVSTVERVATEYGIPVGIAFQLRDDLLGVFGDPARTGKPVSGDISEGKRTVLLALAHERATASQAAILDRHLGDPSLTEEAAAQVKSVLSETGAVAECEALITASVKEAVAALDGAPIPPEARAALAALAVTATDRAE